MTSQVKKSHDELDSFEIVQKYFFNFLDHIWVRLPHRIGVFLAITSALVAVTFLKGNWILIGLSLLRQFGEIKYRNNNITVDLDSEAISLEKLYLKGLPSYLLWTVFSSFAIYLPVCLFFQWYFYYQQKETPETWKIQPRKLVTWKHQKEEILFGMSTLMIGSIIPGFFNCYVYNNGPYTLMYFNVSDKGYLYYLISIPLLYLYIDCTVYYAHRFFHIPFFYRKFHSQHHKFTYPTAFGASAVHPLEFCTYELLSYVPHFFIPIHWSVVAAMSVYIFYYNMESHSGVKLRSIWPWQPSTTFHDNHHQYCKVNYGLNTVLWDKLHGTYSIKEN